MMEVKLQYPITIPASVDRPEVVMDKLVLVDRMKAKHAKLIPDDCYAGGSVSPTRFVGVIAAMANIPESAAEDLDFIDLVKIVGEIVTPFLAELGPPEEK